MAIVRTTTKDTTAGAPPASKPVRSGTPPMRPGVRPVGPRAGVARPGSPKVFLDDTMIELRRVKWPTRDEVSAGTIVTIMLLVFFAIYIFGLDFLAERLFMLIGLYGSHTPVS